MALNDTLVLATFWDELRIVSAEFTLSEAVVADRNGSGEVLTATVGPRLWQGRITMPPGREVLRDTVARLDYLRASGKTFLACPLPGAYPSSDPTGTALAGASPVLSAVAANNRDITISGLPANYRFERGDFVSYTYGASPTRYALHKIIWRVTANGSGVAAGLEVVPPLRPGYIVGQAVTLIKPVIKAVYIPGSFAPPSLMPGGVMTGPSFGFQQTLR